MTNEEKFRAGKVLYKNESGDYVLELWAGSTKHPDSIFHFEDFKMAFWVDPNDEEEVKTQLFPWVCECASKLVMPTHSRELVEWALENWRDW